MAVQLIKNGARIVLGAPFKVHSDKILCDDCGQSYELHYSTGEEHRLKEWLPKAKAAVNNSHANHHPDTVAVPS
jgi:Fe2+ or Zn2+ uptake regulation protein